MRNSCKSKANKQKYLIKNWSEDLTRHFFKEDTQMTKKYMKRCSVQHMWNLMNKLN